MPRHHRGYCALACGDELGTTVVCGYKICDRCVDRIRAIARAAGVAIDEQLIGGELRYRRALTPEERKLEDIQEQREIEQARRSA